MEMIAPLTFWLFSFGKRFTWPSTGRPPIVWPVSCGSASRNPIGLWTPAARRISKTTRPCPPAPIKITSIASLSDDSGARQQKNEPRNVHPPFGPIDSTTFMEDSSAQQSRSLRLRRWLILFVAVGVGLRLFRYALGLPLWGDEGFLGVNILDRSYRQ